MFKEIDILFSFYFLEHTAFLVYFYNSDRDVNLKKTSLSHTKKFNVLFFKTAPP